MLRSLPTLPGLALCLVACATAPAPGAPSPSAAGEARGVVALADEYFAAWVQDFPLSALFAGVPDAPNDLLEDNSLAAVRTRQAREDRWLDRLKQVRPGGLRGRPEEATYGVLLETLEAARQTRVCRTELWPLDQQGGWQIFLPDISQLQPLGTPELRAAALARWRAMPHYIDTEIGNLREGVRAGYSQPRANAQAVLEQLDDILKIPTDASPFAGLAERDSAPGFRDSVVAVVAGEILPAVRRYRRTSPR
jgi:uncharacterized protein (DUF885 family)